MEQEIIALSLGLSFFYDMLRAQVRGQRGDPAAMAAAMLGRFAGRLAGHGIEISPLYNGDISRDRVAAAETVLEKYRDEELWEERDDCCASALTRRGYDSGEWAAQTEMIVGPQLFTVTALELSLRLETLRSERLRLQTEAEKKPGVIDPAMDLGDWLGEKD